MPYTLEEKLEWALAGKARWEARLAAADAMQDRARELGGGIPGFGRSGNQRAASIVRNAHTSADRAWREASEKIAYYSDKAKSYERRIAERDRVRFEHADLVGAKFVRTSITWRKVVRVNAKSVSVDSGYSWTDRLTFDQIREIRK